MFISYNYNRDNVIVCIVVITR